VCVCVYEQCGHMYDVHMYGRVVVYMHIYIYIGT